MSFHFPLLFINIMKFRYRVFLKKDRTVNEETELVVEGFPRSANSYLTRALEISSSIVLSHHTHYSANVILGIKKRKNIFVLFRKPEDAVISSVSLYVQSQVKTNSYSLDDIKEYDLIRLISVTLLDYKRYYSSLKNRNEINFIRFVDVIKNTPGVIGFIGKKCGIEMNLPEDFDTLIKEKAIKNGRYHMAPSLERNIIKDKVTELFHNNVNSALLKDSNELFEDILSSVEKI